MPSASLNSCARMRRLRALTNSACIAVAGHSRNSPGSGSRIGSSRESTKVTDSRPAREAGRLCRLRVERTQLE